MASRSGQRRRQKMAKKSSNTRLVVFAASFIVVAVVIVYALTAPAGEGTIGIGSTAPDFHLPIVTAEGLTSNTIELSSLRGRVVVLEFMVSWCKGCQAMAPSLDYLSSEYESRGVFFLSVAGTVGGASAESTAAFITEYGAHWTHVLDTDNSVFTRYGVQVTPTYLIVDRDGKIVSRFQGVVATDGFRAGIDAALSG